jgi:hypothetical protein
MNEQKSYRSSFILLTILFFLLGFITILVESLIPRLCELFTDSYFQAGLLTNIIDFKLALIYTILCYAYILYCGYKNSKNNFYYETSKLY